MTETYIFNKTNKFNILIYLNVIKIYDYISILAYIRKKNYRNDKSD